MNYHRENRFFNFQTKCGFLSIASTNLYLAMTGDILSAGAIGGLDVRLTADGSIACELKLSDLQWNVGGMAFSADSKRLAVVTSQGIEIFDMEAGKPLQQVYNAKLRLESKGLA